MIRSVNGKTPKIAESAFVSEWVYLVGDVEISENSGLWPGAVIRAIETIQDLSERLLGKLDTFGDAEWRDLLLKLGSILHVDDTNINLPEYREMIFSFCLELPLGKEKIADTVFTTP